MSSFQEVQFIDEKMAGLKPVKVCSFGCGVDSIAGFLILQEEGLIDEYDEILWADTGSEMPETYAYLDYLTKTLGWKIKVIRSKYGKIYDYYKKKHVYPTRLARDCTGKFKIDPINKYLRTMYGKKAHFNIDIFINYDEAHYRMRTSKYKYATLLYPLVDRKITRAQCKETIKKHNMPVPHKSGCFFCWAQPPASWLKLKKDHPDLFQESLDMEHDSKVRHKGVLPLIRLKAKEMKLNPMDDFFDETDEGCGCFNYNIDSEDEADNWKDKPF